jgi:hypothetical protein
MVALYARARGVEVLLEAMKRLRDAGCLPACTPLGRSKRRRTNKQYWTWQASSG